jgi:hypothetical protein
MKMLLLVLTAIAAGPQKIEPEKALKIAEGVHAHIVNDINDYTGILIKRELIDGRSDRQEFISFKFRQKPSTAIYLKYLRPTHMIGREALYKGGNTFLVRRGGTFNPNLVLELRIDSPLAMATSNYTIKEMGLKVIAERLIAQLKNEMNLPETEILMYPDAKFEGRPITHYRLIHHKKVKGATCSMAEISVDKALNIPVFYRAIDGWEKPVIVLEEYGFRNVRLNPGLTDKDFDENNAEYKLKRIEIEEKK